MESGRFNAHEMTRQMAKEILLSGGKVTHKSLISKYLYYDNGIKTEDGTHYTCEFYNNTEFRINWHHYE
jgi:L-2-hydroxyglutarate oxidase LhgO